MTTSDIERAFQQIAELLDLHGENPFKGQAYSRAARAIRSSGQDVAALVAAGEPLGIDGVGKSLEEEIRELVQTGATGVLDDLLEKTPSGLLDILEVRGLGAKKVRTLWQDLGIVTLDQLEDRARAGEIAGVKGFGKKTQENILAGIAELRSTRGKFRLDTATKLAEEILPRLRELAGVARAEIAGRLRRGGEEFDHLSFVVEADDPAAVERAVSMAGLLGDVRRDGRTIEGIFDESVPVTIRVAEPGQFVVALHQHSAPSDYRFMISIPLKERGYELTDDELLRDGEPIALATEEELYELAGMRYVPVELREGIDEVRRALDDTLPELVEQNDLRGVLHVHSIWSDGRNTIAELAERARELGYSYLLMCDHSKAAIYANGLDEARLEAQGKEIDEINLKYDPAEFRVLKGIECDILADGSLDLADDALAALDAVVVSVHSSFTLPEEVQTERVCRALENRYATILAHPTGRLILSRKGYAIDQQRVIAHAAENRKYVELNANPHRLDLSWRMLRFAKRKGVKVAIDPDAHSLRDLEYVRYGVTIARKGCLERGDVLNALSMGDFLAAAARARGES